MTPGSDLALDTAPYGNDVLASWYAPGLSDELGDRLQMFDTSGAPSLELLRFRPALTATPGFEVALRRHVDRLKHFRHPSFARIRAVEYLGPGEGLALLSHHTPGRRLSEILQDARGPAFATALIQQLTPALASLEHHAEGAGHGALAPSRIVVTPEGRLMIVEHVLGPALERLRFSANRLRTEFGIALPPGASAHHRFDSRSDYFQLGIVALSLLLGRQVCASESQEDIAKLLEQVARTTDRQASVLFCRLRPWLERALQLNDQVFESSGDAQAALDDLRSAGSFQATPPSHLPGLPVPTADSRASSAPQNERPASEQDLPADPVARIGPREPAVISGPIALADAVQHWEQLFPSERTADAQRAFRRGEVAQVRLRAPDPREARPKAAPGRSLSSEIEARGGRRRVSQIPGKGSRRRLQALVAVLALCVIAEAFVIAMLLQRSEAEPFSAIIVETLAPGADVLVDGRSAGVTPLQLDIGADTRSIRVVDARPASSEAGQPPAAQITESDRPPPAAAPIEKPRADNVRAAPRPSGGFKVLSPFEVEVFEGDMRLGSSATELLTAAVGRHELDLVNNSLGYRARQIVNVRSGEVVSVRVSPPNGRVSINALPWADVWIAGEWMGTTPLGNLSLPLGEHEILFRHPALGEQRRTTVVRLDAVTRVSANLER